MGLELCAVEANYLVVAALKRFSAFLKNGARDDRPGMGQLIGALERTILYVLIVSGNFTEYFLVGTMASVCVTLVLGLLVRRALA